MLLEEISVDGFRNLQGVRLRPHPRLSVFVGDNGQGKTNLLEAIHLATALRPLRAVERAADLVGFGAERGLIRARFLLDGPADLEVVVEPRGRRATLNGKAVRDVASWADRVGVVSFTPDDAAFIRGGPSERRRGLDRFAFGLWPSFAAVARRFEDSLERRNKVLKSPLVDEQLLASYTPPFVEAAVDLVRVRARACAAWAPVFAREAVAIGGEQLAAEISYSCGFLDEGDAVGHQDDESLRRILDARLAAARSGELRRRATAIGPQLDDVLVDKAGKKARFLASQGEARSLVLALKLAAVRLMTEVRGTGPMLLLDDVAGELDPGRAARLLGAVDDTRAQAFVTTTHEGALPPFGEGAVWTVSAGRVVGEVRRAAGSA